MLYFKKASVEPQGCACIKGKHQTIIEVRDKMDKEENPRLTGSREFAKYYEPIYFYDGHTTLTKENQRHIVEVLDKNSAVGVYGIFEEEDYPIYCVSKFAMTNLGYTFDELLEATDGKFINLIYEKDRQAFTEMYKEEQISDLEFRLITKNQSAIMVHSYRRKAVSLDGRKLCLASVRVIDEAVRRESELLAALTKEYSEIIYIDENKGQCKQIKKAANSDVVIETVEEVRESLQEHMAIIHPDDHAFAKLYERIRKLSSAEMDRGGDYKATYRAKVNGEYIWLQFRAIFGGNMNLDTGHIILTFKRVDEEIQKEYNANRILSESLAKAEEAGRIKNQFLSRMSHDLRTPLNGIMGMIDIIGQAVKNPKKILECSQKIKTSCQHLVSLVNEVLDMNSLESGSVDFEEIAFDFQELVEEVLQYVAVQAEEAGIAFYTDIEEFKHRSIIGSPKHIRQIFVNILDNAVKYNKPTGEIFVRGREVSDSDRLVVYEFVFEDTGYGMDNNFVKRIFEPFEQEHNDARTTYVGVGLGMPIVKKMIDQIQGDIIVKSTKDVGTKVSITLPFRVYSERRETDHKEVQVDLTGIKALLVEDNEINMEIAQFLLESWGLVVYNAVNGQIAVDMFKQSEVGFFDIIIMDLMMPVMDGYEATRQIRAMGREDSQSVPIVALSANVLDADIKNSKMAGMNEHLAKPVDADQVLRTIEKYVRKNIV